MLSKNKRKEITALSLKKHRDESGFFVAEGTKLVLDLAETFKCRTLIATTVWYNEHNQFLANEIIESSEVELRKISNQKTPQGVFAVFEKPKYHFKNEEINGKLSLALDNIQDPGNLGTIIRIADWFGITDIFCSEQSADVFNPKTIQATMGALARVRCHAVNLVEFLNEIHGHLPIYGTFMDGSDIYSETLTSNGIIVMGNEGNGISELVEKQVSKRLLIPNFPKGQQTSESLNVGVATALVCAEFRRRL
jgi:TrmH family RNA methyltransferase